MRILSWDMILMNVTLYRVTYMLILALVIGVLYFVIRKQDNKPARKKSKADRMLEECQFLWSDLITRHRDLVILHKQIITLKKLDQDTSDRFTSWIQNSKPSMFDHGLEKFSSLKIADVVWNTKHTKDSLALFKKEIERNLAMCAKATREGEDILNPPAKKSSSYEYLGYGVLKQLQPNGKYIEIFVN